MLINFLSKRKRDAYLNDGDLNVLSFFSNNTLSIRREALDDVGRYDERFPISEDVEICARIFNSRWNMYQSPFLHLHHRARPSLFALMKQWWLYGFYATRVYALHNRNIAEVFLFAPDVRIDFFDALEHFHLLYYQERVPVNVYVMLNMFWAFHLFLLCAIGAALFSCSGASVVCAALSVGALFWYGKSDFELWHTETIKKSLQLFCVRYCVNLSFAMSGLFSGFSQKTFYLSHIIWDRSHGLSKKHAVVNTVNEKT